MIITNLVAGYSAYSEAHELDTTGVTTDGLIWTTDAWCIKQSARTIAGGC
ncbi:hypothetical protein ACGFOU_13760 [Streptomyces sp. NPDC048595]